MKFKTLIGLCVLALGLTAVQIEWVADWSQDPNAVEFDTVLIGRVRDNTANPVSDSGLYVGYAGTDGYWLSDPMKMLRPRINQMSSLDIEDFNNTDGFYYFMELYSGKDIVAYSDLVSFDIVKWAVNETGMGSVQPWEVRSFNAAVVPEPSSGLLLLIGGALVGLRRKRRAA